MSSERVEVEGTSLEDALEQAASLLKVPRRAIAFEYDRAHLAQGASTVKIIAGVLSAEAQARAAEEEAKRAQAEPPRRAEGDRGGRGRDGGRDRGGRDRGGRGRDRGGPRDDRGGGRDRGGRDRDRGGPRDARGPRGERPPIKHDPERDEALRERARQIAQRVLDGGADQAIDDLNSYERHLVHQVVASFSGLVSQSAPGEERRKTITISKRSE